ncbi:MAG: sigma-54 dependent transcriptional regulator [Alphaproteobacteria bacterium]|nr:sigma-54 dependent transcriptional regulator [Alphaproteobacteria bacterium]MBU0799202.1 sigma-54 dependent transcriptional regulator [Alphaproteobacteria bacterium]MBU0887547.1 sigma-54 dependent transcriptional regulator [Alphaproteobacteria bacterium]MBU1814784.1 sigma-54 dependent transcriptional regulator [Alphaproteobacteria bacterium]MBU2090808.1 sigma-54 dependent transcriptional regulator [Alphaproteobacteria bacterium]
MTDGASILVIEDDPILGPALVQRLRLEGFAPRLATDGATALKVLLQHPPAAVVSDIRLPDMTGEDVFKHALDGVGQVPTFFITAFGDISQAIRLVKAGAKDYLVKPVDIDALVSQLSDACAAADIVEENSLGQSPAISGVEAILRRIAPLDLPVLLLGETGSGKEVAARFLHRVAGGPATGFVAVNCAAIPHELVESTLFGHERGAFTGAVARRPGLVDQAAGGILFLDEIAELPLDLQPKLLRLIQEGTYLPVGAQTEKNFTGRIVCATHTDLKAAVQAGLFREDLYFRINVVEVTIPPLRERGEDIAALAEHFREAAIQRFRAPHRALDPAALGAMRAYDWPGNVRELRNRIERAVALCDGPLIRIADLFPEDGLAASQRDSADAGLEDAVDSVVRGRIEAALRQAGGNKSEAARLLKVSRTTLWKKIRQLDITT